MKPLIALCVLLCTGLSAAGQTLAPSKNDKDLYGFVDESGSYIIKPQYSNVHFEFSDGVAGVVKNRKYLLINTSGKAISKQYSWMDYFDSNNLCLVNQGCTIDENGKPVGGLFGFVDMSGKEVLPVKYAQIGGFNEFGVAQVNMGGTTNKAGYFTGGKYGFIDSKGAVLIAPKYSAVGPYDDHDMAWVNVGGKVSEQGDCTGGLYGYIDRKGVEVIVPKYSFVGSFDEDGVCWVNKGGKPSKASPVTPAVSQKTIDKINSKIGTPPELTGEAKLMADMRTATAQLTENGQGEVRAVSMPLFVSEDAKKLDVNGKKPLGGKYGFINRTGKEFVPVKYYNVANHFVDGVVCASMGSVNKDGYVNREGKEITPMTYLMTEPFRNGFGKVMGKDGRYGFVDHTGKQIGDMKYEFAGDFTDGVVAVGKNLSGKYTKIAGRKTKLAEKYALLNGSGKSTDFKYDMVIASKDVSTGQIGNRYCYIDNVTGQEITPAMLLTAAKFAEGVGCATISAADIAGNRKGVKLTQPDSPSGDTINRKSALIGLDGVALTDFIYEGIGQASGGAVSAIKDGKLGWLDLQGNGIIPFEYEITSQGFAGDISPVKKNGKWGYINKQGKMVVECKYDGVSTEFVNGIAAVCLDSKWGCINERGEIIIPIRLLDVSHLHEVVYDHYLAQGGKPMTDREVDVIGIRIANETRRFSIKDVIAEEYWDF